MTRVVQLNALCAVCFQNLLREAMEMEPLRDVRVYGSPECEHRSHASSFYEDIFHFSWSMKLFDWDSWMKSMVYFGDLLFCIRVCHPESQSCPEQLRFHLWIRGIFFWYSLIPGLKNMSHSSCWRSARHGKCLDLGNWNVMAIARDWQRFVSGFWDLPKAIQAPATEWCAEVSYARSTSCCCREP